MQQDRIGMTEFFGEVILKINIKADKIKAEVYENQDKSLSDLQTLIQHSFLLNFLHKLLVSILSVNKNATCRTYFLEQSKGRGYLF